MLRGKIAATMAVLALLLGAGTPAAGGTRGANFGVAITLSNPSAVAIPAGSPTAAGDASGICTSQSLSESTGALVQVVCRTGQFVSISPRPGRRFPGTHGGAYHYYFGPGYGAIHRSALGEGGAGTVTSFRVYSIEEAEGLLDLLVSF